MRIPLLPDVTVVCVYFNLLKEAIYTYTIYRQLGILMVGKKKRKEITLPYQRRCTASDNIFIPSAHHTLFTGQA